MCIPFWIPTVVAGTLGVLAGTNSWRTRRFSIGAVLIATMLLALLLTAIAASSRYLPTYAT